MRIIDCDADIADALKGLTTADKRLAKVLKVAGAVPLRRAAPGFRGLAEIVVSQQVSKASANAIWGRLTQAVDPFEATVFCRVDDDALREAGLSRPKQKTLRAVSQAIVDGFDLDAVARLDGTDAIAAMTALHGIGPWTAEVYLMFCCGHPDLFPARDVALQNAIQHAFDLGERPGEKDLYAMSERWSPWRATAARLFWAYYAATGRGKDATPV